VAKTTQPVLRSAREGTASGPALHPSETFKIEGFFEADLNVRTKLTRAAWMGVKGAPRLWVELVVDDVDGVGNTTTAPRTATV
jgi:hypothetical protein